MGDRYGFLIIDLLQYVIPAWNSFQLSFTHCNKKPEEVGGPARLLPHVKVVRLDLFWGDTSQV